MSNLLAKYGPRIKSKRVRWVLCFLHLAWVALLYGPDEGVSQSICKNIAEYYYCLTWPKDWRPVPILLTEEEDGYGYISGTSHGRRE